MRSRRRDMTSQITNLINEPPSNVDSNKRGIHTPYASAYPYVTYTSFNSMM